MTELVRRLGRRREEGEEEIGRKNREEEKWVGGGEGGERLGE